MYMMTYSMQSLLFKVYLLDGFLSDGVGMYLCENKNGIILTCMCYVQIKPY